MHSLDFEARCKTLCDKVCQGLVTGRWFSPCPPVSSTNKTDRHDLIKILLKVGVKRHQTNKQNLCSEGVTITFKKKLLKKKLLTTSAISGAGTVYPSGVPHTSGF